MKFKRRPFYSSRDIGILSLIGLVSIMLGSVLIGANIALSRVVHGGGGFFVGLEGARAFLFEHTDPYSEPVARLTQELAYGRTALAGENPYILTTPFFLMPFYFPFAFFSESASARGLWMFFCEAGLVGAAFLALRSIEWRPKWFFLFFFYLISIFNYYSVTALLEGTPVILLVFVYFGILVAFSNERDELAGALLVLTLFYWQVGSLFLIFVIWKTIYDKRWRVLYGFVMTFIILLILSVLIFPGWIFSFIIAIFTSFRSQFGITAGAIFGQLSQAHGNQITQAITILVIAMLIYEWAATRRADFRRFLWAACLTLSATPLLGFRTDLINLAVLFPCLALIFATTADRWKTGILLSSLLLAIVLLVPWAFYVQGSILKDGRFYDYLFLFYPLFTIVGLYWIRWWFIRPPRTWLDQVRTSN